MIRLKDKIRQGHIEAAFPGFHDALQIDGARALFRQMAMAEIGTRNYMDPFNHLEDDDWLVTIPTTNLEEYSTEYNPDGWYKFPEVEPPPGVEMAVEATNNLGETIHGFATYQFCESLDRFDWITEYGNKFLAVDRFRPWFKKD